MQGQKKIQSGYSIQQLFQNLEPYLKKPSPFTGADVQGLYDDYFDNIKTYQILVVGAGGLGCEIVKNLAVGGVRNIHLIDMDTIDVTNLNRQFLFREKDVGRKKAEVVAEFIMRRCPGVVVHPHTSKVQEMDCDFYLKFGIIIGGLDNVEARKFLNAMVHQLNLDSQEISCYYIDGATEGFEGQSLLVYPFDSSCYSCSLLDGLQTKAKVNYCTIANTPRTPQHCIQYVLQIQWEKHYPDTKRDNDNMDHMKWIYQKSLQRAKQFNIEGVTEMLTMGVTKNIIPAIASTNALIAAFCTNQAMKMITGSNPNARNYYIYKGGTSVGSDTYEIGRKPGCTSCLMKENRLQDIQMSVPYDTFFSDLLKKISQNNPVIRARPFVNANGKMIYNPADKQRRQKRDSQTMKQLFDEGVFVQNPQKIIISDSNLKDEQRIIITFTEENS